MPHQLKGKETKSKRLFATVLMAVAIYACVNSPEKPPSAMQASANTPPIAQTIAERSNALSRHSITVKAQPERVWGIWMDAANCPTWEKELTEASSTLPLAIGVEGWLVLKQGPSPVFRVTRFETNRQYVFETALPLAKLTITRSLTQK